VTPLSGPGSTARGVTARRRWCKARDEWAAEAGFARRDVMAMVPSRRPYWSRSD